MSELPKRILSTLMVLGAQTPDKAMSAEEVAAKLGIGSREAAQEIMALVEKGYASVIEGGAPPKMRVYLTGTGIITASSTYS
jgi:predicted ArsR family transcriptional regulator